MCQSELSCGHRGRAVPAARSRCGAIGNFVAGIADNVTDKTPGAICSPLGAREPRTVSQIKPRARPARRHHLPVGEVADRRNG